MFDIDWHQLFVPNTSLAEIAIRGSVIYLLLFTVMRFLPRREVGGMAASDILVIVLIADAVQQGMAGKYESITEALVLAGVIFFWATVLDLVDYHFPQLNLSEPGPVCVVSNGRLLRRNMRRQKVTVEEVMSQVRQHGLQELSEVRVAYIEGDGHFSVVPRHRRSAQAPTRGPQGTR